LDWGIGGARERNVVGAVEEMGNEASATICGLGVDVFDVSLDDELGRHGPGGVRGIIIFG
jgi:hypothetical protein